MLCAILSKPHGIGPDTTHTAHQRNKCMVGLRYSGSFWCGTLHTLEVLLGVLVSQLFASRGYNNFES